MPRARARPSALCSDPTPERLRHAGRDGWHMPDERTRVRTMTMVDRPFERLVIAGKVDQRQYHAGQKFKLHAERVGIHGRFGSIDLGSPASAFDPSRYGNLPPFHLDRYTAAREAMGPILCAIVEAIVVHERQPREIAPELGRSERGRLGVDTVVKQLCAGLDRLADQWM